MRWVRRRLSYANIVASIALFLALGGGAYAVVGNRFVGRTGAIKMCIQSASHVPLVVLPGAACPAGSTSLTLNQLGRRGRRGPRGAQGPKGKTGAAATPPSYIDAYMGMHRTVCGGCVFSFEASDGSAGVQQATVDMRLENDNATFSVATAGVYMVTVTVGPAGPVQLEVNSARVGPDETSCSGTSVCAFQRILDVQAASLITLVNTTSNSEQEDPGSGITIVRIA